MGLFGYSKRFLFLTVGPPISTIAQKMKFSIKDVFSKCDEIRSFLETEV